MHHRTPRMIRRGRRSEQGSALIVTMMVILAITGMGALAFQTAVRSASQARNFQENKQAEFVSEVAVMTGIEWLECNLAFLMDGATFPYQLEEGDPVGCGFRTASLFGAEPFGTRQRDTAYYQVRFAQPVPSRRAPEYDESYCYVRIDMLGRGGLLDGAREGSGGLVSDTELGGARVARRFSANFYAGPVVCPGYGS
jgi:hypothetical protein